jgi:hypothetical protein
VNGVQVEYFCNKFASEEEDREDGNCMEVPTSGKEELRGKRS